MQLDLRSSRRLQLPAPESVSVVVEVVVFEVSWQRIREPGACQRLLVHAAAGVVADTLGEDRLERRQLVCGQRTRVVPGIDLLQSALEDVLGKRLTGGEARVAVYRVHPRAGGRVGDPLAGDGEASVDEARGLVPDDLRRGAPVAGVVDDVLHP